MPLRDEFPLRHAIFGCFEGKGNFFQILAILPAEDMTGDRGYMIFFLCDMPFVRDDHRSLRLILLASISHDGASHFAGSQFLWPAPLASGFTLISVIAVTSRTRQRRLAGVMFGHTPARDPERRLRCGRRVYFNTCSLLPPNALFALYVHAF